MFIAHVFESVFIETKGSGNSNMLIGVIYRPNSPPLADMDLFTSTLYNIMNTINRENKSSILLGDMNVDLLKYSLHNKTNEYLDGIVSHGFLPVITIPTRLTISSATLIDHIYVNRPSLVDKPGVILTDIADHFGTFLLLTKQKNKTKISKNKEVRIFSQTNINNFREILHNTNFDVIYTTNCPNESFDKFIALYSSAYERAFPLKHIKPNRKYIKREPWVNDELLRSANEKSKLFIKKKISN